MKRSVAFVAVLAAVVAAPAAAKGPTAATITGPGLQAPIQLHGDPEGAPDSRFGRLLQGGGFFQQVFRQVPDATLRAQPKVRLGPRYDVVYLLPTPAGKALIRQQLYPYAQGGPLTYVQPGQVFYGGMETRGGWIQAPQGLLPTLVTFGLPSRAPSLTQSGLGPGAWAGIATGIALAAGAAGALVRRHRSGNASA
jgi:hypothetical protein